MSMCNIVTYNLCGIYSISKATSDQPTPLTTDYKNEQKQKANDGD